MRIAGSSLLLALVSLACSSAQKTETVTNTQTTEIRREKNEVAKETRQRDAITATQTDFAEGWISADRAQAFYSTTADNLKEETDILLARERLAWLLLLERYDLQREDRVIATQLAKSNLFQQFGTEKIEKQTKGERVTILLSKSKPGLRAEWENTLVAIENRFPELKNRRRKD